MIGQEGGGRRWGEGGGRVSRWAEGGKSGVETRNNYWGPENETELALDGLAESIAMFMLQIPPPLHVQKSAQVWEFRPRNLGIEI